MIKLTEKTLSALARIPGRHPVPKADGLKLKVIDEGRRAYWTYRYRFNGEGAEIGLGALSDVPTIAAAKTLHAQALAQVRTGVDPRGDKRARRDALAAASAMPTFGEAAQQYIDLHEHEWSNPTHRQQWRVTLLGPEGTAPRSSAPQPDHCRALRHLPIDKITKKDVLTVLDPIWRTKSETASRIRGRIEAVLDFAYVRHDLEDKLVNPARWRGLLNKALPKRKKRINNHLAALPYKDIPAFIARLRRPTSAARALEFLILTAARAGEALNMTWDEVDFGEKVWTIPPERMKTRQRHRVPLSDRTLEILRAQHEAKARRPSTPYAFAGLLPGRPLSRPTLAALIETLSPGVTLHGFRSSFRDWALVAAQASEAVAEQCLAHMIGSDVRKAYARDDLLELRTPLMAEWASYCGSARPVVVNRREACGFQHSSHPRPRRKNRRQTWPG
jgi:integrase